MIGNPPFLGGNRLVSNLGEDFVSQVFATYAGRVPASADLVCYWFEKAGKQIASGKTARAGLVATNSIRGGANRRALRAATEGHRIFEAWSDEPWVLDGAAVRVSLVCFSRINDRAVQTARHGHVGIDLTKARHLSVNASASFKGDEKGGASSVPGEFAREWLRLPANPNGRTNADVLKPWINGMEVARRPNDKWIGDFGNRISDVEAALYEEPFGWLKEHVYPKRQENRIKRNRVQWNLHRRPVPDMWRALSGMKRYIATPYVSKHRLFVWCDVRIFPDKQLIVIARDDDTTFGILQIRFHEIWSLRLGTSLEDRPRYTPTTTFETFPFPEGLTPDMPAAAYADDPRAVPIAHAARRLVELRDRWLNPPEWVEWVDEPVPAYPRRPVPRHGDAATALKKRTLTNLHNARPQ